MFNLGQQTVTLRRRERFCALCIFEVADTARLYNKPGKGLEGRRVDTGPWARFSDWLQRHDAIVKTVIGLLTVTVAAVQAAKQLGFIGP